jgi:hypothetical protein
MNRNPENIERRRDDLVIEINSRKNERVADVIRDFALRHYISESTAWKDYKSAGGDETPRCRGVNSKHY